MPAKEPALKGRPNSTCVQHGNILLYLCGTVALAFDYSYRLFDEGSATQSHVSGWTAATLETPSSCFRRALPLGLKSTRFGRPFRAGSVSA